MNFERLLVSWNTMCLCKKVPGCEAVRKEWACHHADLTNGASALNAAVSQTPWYDQEGKRICCFETGFY